MIASAPQLTCSAPNRRWSCGAPLWWCALLDVCLPHTGGVVDIGLDLDGAIEHLRRQLAIVETINKLDGQLSPDPYRLAEPGSELAALAETALDAPVNLLLSIRAGLTAARGALDQIASLLGHNLPIDAIVLQALLRTALLGAGRVVLALAPADPEQRQRNVRVVLRQESRSLIEPVMLTGDLVLLEPLLAQDHDAPQEAAADGQLWNLSYTHVPRPEQMPSAIQDCLAGQAAGTLVPLNDSTSQHRSHHRHDHLLRHRPGQPPPRDRRHLERPVSATNRHQHREQTLAARTPSTSWTASRWSSVRAGSTTSLVAPSSGWEPSQAGRRPTQP